MTVQMAIFYWGGYRMSKDDSVNVVIVSTCHPNVHAGLWTHWLAPLLVFHGWLSTLTLLHHTAPQVPWRFTGQHDLGQAIISGTVTVQMPAWLEALLNYPNYSLPQHLMFNGVPFYHAKAATQALREKLWPYMQVIERI